MTNVSCWCALYTPLIRCKSCLVKARYKSVVVLYCTAWKRNWSDVPISSLRVVAGLSPDGGLFQRFHLGLAQIVKRGLNRTLTNTLQPPENSLLDRAGVRSASE